MKNGIDLILILILLATIGFLVYFGVGGGTSVEQPVPVAAIVTTEIASPTETIFPTTAQTATLIPASVTIPTKTATFTPKPTGTFTRTPTATLTPTVANITPVTSLDQEIKTGIERGNRIVQAIEAYHTAKGEYPPSLNALTPVYLNDLPITSNGQAYFYRLFDTGSPLASDVYWVSFRAINQDHVSCTYIRMLDYWDCNYASP